MIVMTMLMHSIHAVVYNYCVGEVSLFVFRMHVVIMHGEDMDCNFTTPSFNP